MKVNNKVQTKKLCNPKSFIIFSVFFSFLPAGIMCALNYGRCGDNRKKWTILLSTILGFIALITVVSLFTLNTSNTSAIFFPINIGVGILLWCIQRKLYEEHIQKGGQRASYLLPIITGLIVFSISAAWVFYSIYVPDKVLSYTNNHIFYTNNVTETQAKELGDYLKTKSYFASNTQIDLKIDKQEDMYVLSVVVKEDYLNNEDFINSMKTFSKELSQKVFENDKVRINFCDDRFKALKYVRAD